MTIEYQIKRMDIVRAYFYNLRHSRRTQTIVFGMGALLVGYELFLAYDFRGQLTPVDYVVALFAGLSIIFIFLPVFNFIFAKTPKRILTANPEGIETTIGNKSGKIAWRSVAQIISEPQRIIIIGKNANAFIIPARAFNNAEQQKEFDALVKQYIGKP